MQTLNTILFWKEAPFMRILVPFVAGILVQWYGHTTALTGWGLMMGSCISLSVFSFSTFSFQFRNKSWNEKMMHDLLDPTGMLITYHNDFHHYPNCVNKYYSVRNTIIASIEEPLSEKKQSSRALASVQAMIRSNGVMKASKGNVLV